MRCEESVQQKLRRQGHTDWHLASEMTPPENTVVETITSGGNPMRTRWNGRLWLTPEGDMYVYYGVKYWREIG